MILSPIEWLSLIAIFITTTIAMERHTNAIVGVINTAATTNLMLLALPYRHNCYQLILLEYNHTSLSLLNLVGLHEKNMGSNSPNSTYWKHRLNPTLHIIASSAIPTIEKFLLPLQSVIFFLRGKKRRKDYHTSEIGVNLIFFCTCTYEIYTSVNHFYY